MKLRNKKTGEVVDAYSIDINGVEIIRVQYFTKNGKRKLDHFDFNTLEELNDCLEDYTPAEPLIKDEKIRKAVRAWAEADDLDNFRVQNQHFNGCKIIGYTAGIRKASFIGFQTTIAHADNEKLYTIAELCGEEEE